MNARDCVLLEEIREERLPQLELAAHEKIGEVAPAPAQWRLWALGGPGGGHV